MNAKKNDIKVSVCVVTYNQEKYIGRCLESIISQSIDWPIEIIVADDFSTDNTRKIIDFYKDKYPNLINKIYQSENVGPCGNYISAHYAARGEYVAHCDGDDYWYLDKLKRQISVLDKNIDAIQCWTFADIVDDSGNRKKLFPSRFAKLLYPKIINTKDIVNSYALVGHHSTQVYRKSARKKNDQEVFLDYWIAFNLSLSGKSVYLKEVLSAYRVTSKESLTRNVKTKKFAVDYLSLHLLEIAKKYPIYAVRAKSNLLSRLLFSKIKGHDTSILIDHLNQLDGISSNPIYFLNSCYWFLLQKL